MNEKQKLALLRHLFDPSIDVFHFFFNAYEEEMFGMDVGVLHLRFRDGGGNYHHIGITLDGKERTYVEEMT